MRSQLRPSRSPGRRPEHPIKPMIFGLRRSPPPVIRLLRPDRAAPDPVRGRLLGFVLSRLAADEAEILTIAVDAAHQGRGVGRALLSENLRQVTNAGAKAMFLEVAKDNAPALALYERFGFVKVGQRGGFYRRTD